MGVINMKKIPHWTKRKMRDFENIKPKTVTENISKDRKISNSVFQLLTENEFVRLTSSEINTTVIYSEG